MDTVEIPKVDLVPVDQLRCARLLATVTAPKLMLAANREETLKREPAERLAFQATQQVVRRYEALVRGNKCLRCWYSPLRCICSKMPSLDVPHEVLLLLHHKEFGRLSNTGKIIAASCPNVTVFIVGIKEHEKRFRERLAQAEHPAFVLFPAVGSIGVPELVARHALSTPPPKRVRVETDAGSGADAPEAPSPVRPFTIVVVDGTWNQAKHAARIVPAEVPRVHVDPTAASLFVLRAQTQPDRICTLEAFALLLREMGHDVSQSRALIAALKVHVDAALEDRGCSAVYGDEADGDELDEADADGSAPGRPQSIDRRALKAAKRKRSEMAKAASAVAGSK